MRTIEVYHITGPERQLISRMWFLNDSYFQDTAVRLTTAAPCNTLRRDRYEACQIRLVFQNGFETEYHTDGLPTKILNICTEYAIFYAQARKMAESKGRLFSWLYAGPERQHRAILKQMHRAAKLLNNPNKRIVHC